MALPGNVDKVTLTGTYMDASGVPCSGTVTFTPAPAIIRDPDANVMITDFPFVATLDSDGHFEIELIVTDDPDLIPSPWYYRVTERLNDHSRSYNIELPLSLGDQDISDIAPSVALPAVVTYVPQATYLAHVNSGTNVHGIASTANLETKAGAQAKANAAATSAVSSAKSYADATFSTQDYVDDTFVPKGRLCLDIRDFGAVGDGSTDDTAAIQAAIDQAIGGTPAGGAAGVREARASVYIPSGASALGVKYNFRITSKLKIYSTLGFHLFGDGEGSRLYADAVGMDYMIDINGAYRGIFENFCLIGSGTATVETALGLNWDVAVSQRTSTNNLFSHIDIRNLKYKIGFGIGSESGSVQVDMNRVVSCRAMGGDIGVLVPVIDPTWWQAGFQSGSVTTAGNQIAHWYNGCVSVGHKYNFRINNVMASIIQADMGYAQADIYHTGTNHLRVQGMRSEHSIRFYEQQGGASYSSSFTIEDIRWSDVNLHADHRFMLIQYGGTYSIRNLKVEKAGSITDPHIYMSTTVADSRVITLNVDGIMAATPIDQLFVSADATSTAHVTVTNYVRYDGAILDRVPVWHKAFQAFTPTQMPTFVDGLMSAGMFVAPYSDLGSPLTAGEMTFDRKLMSGSVAANTSGSLVFSYFRATKSEAINSVAMWTSATVVATPTLIRVGIYSVAANGDITLVASTANDTALLTVASTKYTKSLSSTFNKVAGKRYAVGLLVVAGTVPTMYGLAMPAATLMNFVGALEPRISGEIAGLTDLPAGALSATVTTSRRPGIFELIP